MVKLKPYLIVAFVTVWFQVFAQEIPRDTSYTVWSTYQKLKKQYPQIKVVKPIPLHDKIEQRFNVTFLIVENKRELKADLFYPRMSKQKLPAVVLVHGGGWRSGDKSMNIPLAQQLALNGYFVISVEYQLSLEAKYPTAVHNLKASVRWLRSKSKEFNINENYIAMIGGSAGGQLVSLIGATNDNPAYEGKQGYEEFSSEVQAVVDLDGLLDFTDQENLAVRTTNSADVFWLQGHYDSIPDKWREASALYQVTKKSPPFLFINSSQTRFHAGCKAMVAKLDALKIESQVVELKDAPHSYWFFDPWFRPMTDHIILFLNRTSKNRS